ncbi:MAG: nucleotidyltransferase domain-containing protein [Nanoarchaeota archaeon]|nr:nucleotidyltransferase domain-containing protein [Nanoarchaeota archaeon]MBU0977025.1 nucleotidyltransferase domain-containing protein [Nanoarchaeota archaeon]
MELISYALDCTSFIIQNLKDKDKIKSVILFGSSARGTASNESDVDLFIDVAADEKKLEKTIQKIIGKFLDSIKCRNYWKPLGIENDINPVIGNLEKWKLRDSMLGSSIILYQKYVPQLSEGKNKAILGWGAIKPESKRVMLNKKLFGSAHKKRFYQGMVSQHEGVKIGSNVILVPIESLNIFLKLFRSAKIQVKIHRLFLYDN